MFDQLWRNHLYKGVHGKIFTALNIYFSIQLLLLNQCLWSTHVTRQELNCDPVNAFISDLGYFIAMRLDLLHRTSVFSANSETYFSNVIIKLWPFIWVDSWGVCFESSTDFFKLLYFLAFYDSGASLLSISLLILSSGGFYL